MIHPWCKNKKAFNGKVKNGIAPKILTGDKVLEQLETLGNITFGKGSKKGTWRC